MSVNPSLRPPNPTARAIAAAAPAFDINQFLATLPPSINSSHPVPNPTKARQTVPDSAPARNKPIPATHLNPPPPSSILNPPSSPSSRPPRPLTADQLRAISFLIDGLSTTAIAHALCINRHTLARWKRHPLFQQELRRFIRVPVVCR